MDNCLCSTGRLGRWAVHSASFASKWFSADGRTAWLVFSDDGSFSVWRGTLELVADWQTTRIPVNRGDSGWPPARFLSHYEHSRNQWNRRELNPNDEKELTEVIS